MQALRTAATGMAAQQLNVEVISNNIANMNTVGFKKQRAEFQDLLYQTIERAGAQSSDQGKAVSGEVGMSGFSVTASARMFGAGVAEGNKVSCRVVILRIGEITPTGDVRPVALKDSVALLIDFHLSYAGHSGPFQAEGHSADTGAKVDEGHNAPGSADCW